MQDWLNAAFEFHEKIIKTLFVFFKKTKFCEKRINECKNKIDIIFQFGGMWMPTANIKDLHIPYVLFLDYTMKLAGKYPLHLPFNSQKEKWHELEHLLYRNASLIFTSSENTRRSILYDYGIEGGKVIKSGVGLTLDTLPNTKIKNDDGKTLLFVGKDFKRKGGFYLVEAFKKVKTVIPDARLLIVGPRKQQLKIDDSGITVLGKISDRSYIESLFQKASIFVMPSLCEPFGLVFLEAMAHRLPCIGTNLDAMPEIIEDEKTGFLVPPGESEVLVEKIIFLLENSTLIKEMGERGYLRLKEKFSWDNVVQTVDFHLKKLIDKSN